MFDGKDVIQHKGLAMDLPLSSVLACLLTSLLTSLSCVLAQVKVVRLSIQFTIEEEREAQLPF